MTDTTIQTYVENFEKYIEKTPNIVSGDYKLLLDKFCDLISDEKKVFELGSAFLRDSKYMRDKGLIVTCSDVIPQTLELAKKENFENMYFNFRDEVKHEVKNKFDAVLAKAVLLHANKEDFVFAIKNIYEILKQGGYFYITLKKGSGEEIEKEKLGGDRYFKYWEKEEVWEILQKTGFELVEFGYLENQKWLGFIVRK